MPRPFTGHRTPLGQTLRQVRQQLGLTQEELAQRTGLKRSWLSLVESGEIPNPSASRLAKLAGALGLSPEAMGQLTGYRAAPDPLSDPRFELMFHQIKELTLEEQQEVREFVAYIMHRRRLRGGSGGDDT